MIGGGSGGGGGGGRAPGARAPSIRQIIYSSRITNVYVSVKRHTCMAALVAPTLGPKLWI